MSKTEKTPTLTAEGAETVCRAFIGFVRGRSAVRVNPADYGFRQMMSRDELIDARAAYNQDRNEIRKQTRELDKAWAEIQWRNKIDLAAALIEASKPSRLEYVGGEGRGYDNHGNTWHYTPGQYQPTEIRACAASVCRQAKRILDRA